MDAVTFILSWNKVVDSVLFTSCVIQSNLPTHFQENVMPWNKGLLFFYFLVACCSTDDSVYLRCNLRGGLSLFFRWYPNSVWGLGEYLIFFFPYFLIACILWKKCWRHFKTAAAWLIYSAEQWGRWRNNDFSSGALLPLVLLSQTPTKGGVLLLIEDTFICNFNSCCLHY